ncbi:MAG: hypothetical protein AAB490_02800 [Patescibacteria group bacterium]
MNHFLTEQDHAFVERMVEYQNARANRWFGLTMAVLMFALLLTTIATEENLWVAIFCGFVTVLAGIYFVLCQQIVVRFRRSSETRAADPRKGDATS